MKEISTSLIFLLGFSFCCQIFFPVTVLSQEKHEIQSNFRFSIFGAEKVCLGEPIIVEARLTNDGNLDIKADTASIWTTFYEIAYDRPSTEPTTGGLPLKIPQIRGTHADIGFQISGKSTLLSIVKGETFSSFLVLNRNSDDFYRLSGKYAIRSVFSLNSPTEGDREVSILPKPVEARHVFQIVKCE